MGLVIFIFAAISFSTKMISPLAVPISKSFGLSGFESGLIPLSFFIAYLISQLFIGLKFIRKKSWSYCWYFVHGRYWRSHRSIYHWHFKRYYRLATGHVL